MKGILTIMLLIGGSCAWAQNFQTGITTITYIDSSRSNRAIEVEIHYPADSTGANVPFAADSFPFVVFGHGFVMTPSAYYPFSDTFNKYGYIFAFPTTESSISPSHTDFAKDLIYVYNAVIAANGDSASSLYQHVVSRGAIAGHSMGGGCAVLSAQYGNPAICYTTLAEATTSPSSITAAPLMTRPYLSFAGSYDCIAPYATNQLPTYDSSGSPCKYLVEITGASHCQFGAGTSTCSLGETVSGCANPPLSRDLQINTVLAYMKPYLDYYLKGLTNAKAIFDSVYSGDSVNNRTMSCGTVTNGISDLDVTDISIYPNPANSMIHMRAGSKISCLRLWDCAGRLQMQRTLASTSVDLDLDALSPGLYVVELATAGSVFHRVIVKK